MTYIESDSIQRLQDPGPERPDECRRCGHTGDERAFLRCTRCFDSLCDSCATHIEFETGMCRKCMQSDRQWGDVGYLLVQLGDLRREMEASLALGFDTPEQAAHALGSARGMMRVWVGRLEAEGI